MLELFRAHGLLAMDITMKPQKIEVSQYFGNGGGHDLILALACDVIMCFLVVIVTVQEKHIHSRYELD